MPTSSTRRSRRPTRSSISRRRSACVTSSTTRSARCAPTPGAPSTCSMRVRVIAAGCCSPRRPRSTESRRACPGARTTTGCSARPMWRAGRTATAKALDEHLALAHANVGLPVTIVRYFNSYGPRLDPRGYGSVVARFLGQALAGEPLTVHGDGSQTRCFTYVADTVRGTLLAARSPDVARSSVQHRVRRRDHAQRPRPDDHRPHGVVLDDRAREPRSRSTARGSRTLRADAPTSPEHAPSSGGSQRWRSKTACVARWQWWSTANG